MKMSCENDQPQVGHETRLSSLMPWKMFSVHFYDLKQYIIGEGLDIYNQPGINMFPC